MIRTLTAIAIMISVLLTLFSFSPWAHALEDNLSVHVYTDRHHPPVVPPSVAAAVTVHEVDRLSRWAETVAVEIEQGNVERIAEHVKLVGEQSRAQLKAWAESEWRARTALQNLGLTAPAVVVRNARQVRCVVPDTADVAAALEHCR